MPIAEEGLDKVEAETLPAVFEHACNVYRLMESEAKLVQRLGLSPEEQGGDRDLIWTGHLTKLFGRLHLSTPYYTSVTRELKRMGCISQKRRGGGNAPSEWYILQEPTEELFRKDNRTGHLATRRHDRVSALEQQLRDQSKVIARIQADYEAILDILQERDSA
jgi:hypothetical protein